MFTLTEIFSIIVIHWIADFVLQTDKQAKGKSKNWSDLLMHTLTYSLVWIGIGLIWMLFDIKNASNIAGMVLWFFPITFITHTIIDYFTSRLNSKLWAKGQTHNFFVSVGFDQILHYIQLFLTYYLLFKAT